MQWDGQEKFKTQLNKNNSEEDPDAICASNSFFTFIPESTLADFSRDPPEKT